MDISIDRPGLRLFSQRIDLSGSSQRQHDAVGTPVGQRRDEQGAMEGLVWTDAQGQGLARGREGLPSHAALSWKVVVSDWWWTIWKLQFRAGGANGDIAL